MAVSDADSVPQRPTQLISLPNPATLAEKKRKKRARTMRWRKMKRLRKHLAAGTIIYFTYFFNSPFFYIFIFLTSTALVNLKKKKKKTLSLLKVRFFCLSVPGSLSAAQRPVKASFERIKQEKIRRRQRNGKGRGNSILLQL
jgi:hypothetical protein